MSMTQMAVQYPKISGYRFLRKIATGGCAEVFEAVSDKEKAKVAVKILAMRHITNKTEYKRLLDEGALGLQLRHHDNVARTIKVGQADKRPYTIQEFCPGQSLGEFIAKKQVFNEVQLYHIARGIIVGIQYVHSEGILHKDLKPDNLMFNPPTGLKIIDFGFAQKKRFSIKNLFNSRLEGSPNYMAPELLKTKKATEMTDIYALGISLYETATGQVPFYGQNEQDVINKILNPNVTVRNPRSLNPKISPIFSQFILRCMARKPDDRFRNAAELLMTLNRNPTAQKLKIR